MKIRYVFEDFTRPLGSAPKVLVNLCDSKKDWTDPQSLFLAKRYPLCYSEFKKWQNDSLNNSFNLNKNSVTISGSALSMGSVQIVDVTKRGWIFNRYKLADLWVANAIALKTPGKYGSAISLAGIKKAFERIASFAHSENALVHMAKFEQGSKWEIIEQMVEEIFFNHDYQTGVIVYDTK